MTVQLSVALRNARLDTIETVIGASPVLEIRTGAQPANCAAADSGTLLASITLPSNWASDAASGVKSLLGTWTDSAADATGTAAHFRLKSSGGTVHMQGSVGTSAADLIVPQTSFVATQPFTVSAWNLTDANA
jgi:hypothetical protein